MLNLKLRNTPRESIGKNTTNVKSESKCSDIICLFPQGIFQMTNLLGK